MVSRVGIEPCIPNASPGSVSIGIYRALKWISMTLSSSVLPAKAENTRNPDAQGNASSVRLDTQAADPLTA